jgi:hypothetical protein
MPTPSGRCELLKISRFAAPVHLPQFEGQPERPRRHRVVLSGARLGAAMDGVELAQGGEAAGCWSVGRLVRRLVDWLEGRLVGG